MNDVKLSKEETKLLKAVEAGLTQKQIAEILQTNKSNISRLESVSSNISPKLSTLTNYAAAVGYKLKIEFVPDNEARRPE